MIDLLILVHNSGDEARSLFNGITELNYYNRHRQHEQNYSYDGISVYTNSFSQLDKSDFLAEDDENHFFVIGDVFYRNRFSHLKKSRLEISEVIAVIEGDYSAFHHKIKGNYVYIKVNKISKEVLIVNSPLGVRPIYYSSDPSYTLVSTNMSFIAKIRESNSINNTALISYALFDTIIGHHTILRDVYMLQYGEKIKISSGTIERIKYYDTIELLKRTPIERKLAIEEISTSLKTNIDLFPVNQPFLLGLTGGFDGRMNLALIDEQNLSNVIAYTYGMDGSKEIEIASEIARKKGIRHEIVSLGKDYESKYLDMADETLLISDGYAPFMRCNYMYSHEILSSYSRECMTGMYGSEIIRPMHVMADDVSLTSDTVAAFLSGDILESVEKMMDYQSQNGFFRDSVFHQNNKVELLEMVNKYIVNESNLSREFLLYNFYLNEGMRKFFMEIIRVDRYFVNHHLPYLDLDFFESVITSEYAGIHNNAFKESPYQRRKGQFLYVDVMDRFAKDLNYIKVDRGYSPHRLKGGLNWLIVGLGFYFGKKLRKKIKGNDTFNTKVWRNRVYEANIETLKREDPWFNNSLFSRFNDKYHLVTKNEHIYARHYSLKRWFELIQGYINL